MIENQVESRKAKLEEIRKKDPEKAKKIAENDLWTSVLAKAQGIKIKDDASLLKKTIKKREKQKEKSKKEWYFLFLSMTLLPSHAKPH